MTIEIIGITVLWIFLYGYLIVASIDFGAGFYSYFAKVTRKEHSIRTVINRYLSPVWEVTNVFLVFFFIGIIGFFPDTAFYYGTALLVPASIALVLLSIRGSFYAFANYGARESSFYVFLYGISGLLIPAALSMVLVVSEGGFIVYDGEAVTLLKDKLFLSPFAWTVVLLAVVSVLFISASFLTYYAAQIEDNEAFELLRRFALIWSVPTILAGFLFFFMLNTHNSEHFQAMVDLYWMFAAALICFLASVWLFYKKKRVGLAFVLVWFQYAFAFFGYGASHLPYLLYPYVTIYESITGPEMGWALIIAFIAGLVLLVPSLYLLLRLFIFNAKHASH